MFVKIISNDKQLMTATGPGWWWSSLNHSEVKTARLAVWHGACCIKSILVSNVINHGCGHYSESESSWQCLLDDSPLTAQPRHSHPCDDSGLFMLHITLCRSLSLTKLMMRCAWNVKIEQTFFHQKKEFFLQQYMIRSFNVIVMRPIYSLEWMFSSFSQGQGRRVAWKTKTMINLKVLTPWMTHLNLN